MTTFYDILINTISHRWQQDHMPFLAPFTHNYNYIPAMFLRSSPQLCRKDIYVSIHTCMKLILTCKNILCQSKSAIREKQKKKNKKKKKTKKKKKKKQQKSRTVENSESFINCNYFIFFFMTCNFEKKSK